MRIKKSLLAMAGVLALLLSGCGAASSDSSPNTAPPTTGLPSATTPVQSTAQPSPSASAAPSQPAETDPELQLEKAAREIVDILRDRDLERLAEVIDNEQGVRFAPYPHLDEKTSLHFKSGELPGFKDTKKLIWGSYDGSGEPIELTFRDYFEKFVYDQDFASAPVVSVNKLTGKGNTPFNGLELYPDASFVEFHFPGFDKSNEGMDWESLILVLRQVDNDWKLSAVVHGQWTI